MLKGLDPQLDADVLHALRAMGHGDVVVLVDTNFPAESCAAHTTVGTALAIDNVTLAQAASAVLSVLPLDGTDPDPVRRMQVGDDPNHVPNVQAELADALRAAGEDPTMAPTARFDFYDIAKGAFAIIRTGERRFFGCVAFTKGIIGPEG
ncbi:MAG: RbsD/FucU domain-containing protein [Pseudomonadota bacterium]